MAVLAIFILSALAAAVYFYRKQQQGRFQPQSIRNKRVLITGSSSGIGEQLAYEYSKLGARLLLTARREQLLEKVASRCKAFGAKEVEILPGDMASGGHQDKLVELTRKSMGGLDHLILNHAKLLYKWTGTADDVNVLNDVMEVNFVSYVQLAIKCFPMLSESQGNIAVVTSAGGKVGVAGSSHYCASKFALHGFFSSWRQELIEKKTGVSITFCVLGFIKTEAAMNLLTQNNLGFHESIGASVEDTAVAILQSVTERVYELYYPRLAWIIVNVHKLFPEFLERATTRYAHRK